ncbi:hypothetical protein Marky_2184 [Marinithermus hydrothermalis DSM 14884]|uniref:Uncharacterized protein n=1 Tax=Marinithermus hydrothermalis (strain DSM 14884 / JCM 11576 / T1) TaxID=869210 RepID=F2NR56_MARHT|nr:hypothetical protein Marky_2184 [Marinithermus hydrothermalis DSM 14884]
MRDMREVQVLSMYTGNESTYTTMARRSIFVGLVPLQNIDAAIKIKPIEKDLKACKKVIGVGRVIPKITTNTFVCYLIWTPKM